jgi:ACS family glucarate transporter-like MFS transporter
MEASRTGGVRWMLVGWMFVMSAVAYLDRVNISIAGKDLAPEFHLSNVQFGHILSAFLIGYAACQVPGGRLAETWGARRVLTFGIIWWGIFTALTASVPAAMAGGLFVFVAVRFLLGCGEAVVYPSCNRMVAGWIPVSERGFANGVIFAGVGFGTSISSPLITWIMLNWGWRWSFWFSAAVGFVTAAVWFVIARDNPEEHAWVGADEKQWIRSGLDVPKKKVGMPWAKALSSREVIALALSYFTFGYSAYIFFTWFFLYLVNVRGLNLKASAFYNMLPGLAMMAGSLLGGLINDAVTKRLGQRAGRGGIAAIGMALSSMFIALGSHVQDARLAAVVLAGGAGALYLSQSSFFSTTADVGGVFAGSISGMMNTGNQIGGAITASLTPWIADKYGWNASFGVAAALCVLGATAWLVIDPKRKLLSDSDLASTTD